LGSLKFALNQVENNPESTIQDFYKTLSRNMNLSFGRNDFTARNLAKDRSDFFFSLSILLDHVFEWVVCGCLRLFVMIFDFSIWF